jgi:hypothetical protein
MRWIGIKEIHEICQDTQLEVPNDTGLLEKIIHLVTVTLSSE